MLAFDFDSTLIIKIILIASQPNIILQYCSCESYILITFLITLKKNLSFPFTQHALYWKVLFFLIVISK